MKIKDVREKYLKYFESKGHKIIPSSSLVPKDDPTTLFTGSGMQPLLPYLLGKSHPEGTRVTDSQKCFRADDIEEIGNTRHTTCFEMLGNWSFGDYFKEEQLTWFFGFVTDELGLDPENLYVSAFIGDAANDIPKDLESAEIWKKLFKQKNIHAKDIEIGSEEDGYKKGMQGGRIFYYDAGKNWWSRAGRPEKMPAGEPGGPDSEMFYEFKEIKHDKRYGEHCHPNCDCGRFIEIGNSVFMEYLKNEDGTFSPLPQKNVDFGGGLERLAAASIGSSDIYETDIYKNIMRKIEEVTGKSYEGSSEETRRSFRILADHIKGASFIMADGIRPSNLGQGYILRRLIRRAVRYAKLSEIFEDKMCSKIASTIIMDYRDCYPELERAKDLIMSELDLEEAKFLKTLELGTKQYQKLTENNKSIGGKEAFDLFATHGFPIEMTLEMAAEDGVTVDEIGFRREFEEHQKVSRADIDKRKFEGGLENKEDPRVLQYHTLAHLILAALRQVLGTHVHQKGSNITAERVRFDFSHPEKMTDEEKQRVEAWVNENLAQKLEVFVTETDPKTAKEKGAEGEFSAKYGDKISVYTIGGELGSGKEVSAEICGGPHVASLSEIEGKFRIKKEESSSSGVRRIKAVLE
jgi:alanyl-tRNA synthetase